jgi:hypothetical protein
MLCASHCAIRLLGEHAKCLAEAKRARRAQQRKEETTMLVYEVAALAAAEATGGATQVAEARAALEQAHVSGRSTTDLVSSHFSISVCVCALMCLRAL